MSDLSFQPWQRETYTYDTSVIHIWNTQMSTESWVPLWNHHAKHYSFPSGWLSFYCHSKMKGIHFAFRFCVVCVCFHCWGHQTVSVILSCAPHFSLTLAFKQLILILPFVPVLPELVAGSCHANPKSWGPAARSQAAISIFLIAPDCPPKTF